jgi:peptidoglycan/LPS O-acetylase OafA/YrhL
MTNPTTAAQRYHSLDGLRAVMMLLGIVLHVISAYSNAPGVWWYKDNVTHPLADLTLVFLHTFRLPVFFVMAGFFGALLYTRRGWTGLAKNRAKRILLPLLVFLVVLYPILKAGWFYGTIWSKPGAAAATLSFIMENRYWKAIEPGHLWFLEYLLIAYVLGLIAIPLSRRLVGPGTEAWFRAAVTSRWRAALFAIPTFATLTAMDWGVLDSPHAFVPIPRVVAAYAVFFFFGWALYFHRDLIAGFSRGAWTATLAAVVLGVVNYALARRQFSPQPHFEALGFYGTAATGAHRLADDLRRHGAVRTVFRPSVGLDALSVRFRVLAVLGPCPRGAGSAVGVQGGDYELGSEVADRDRPVGSCTVAQLRTAGAPHLVGCHAQWA